ncbi:MAG: TIGR00730 family Rossman fold protein [Hyphomicrobiaceae bacterium]
MQKKNIHKNNTSTDAGDEHLPAPLAPIVDNICVYCGSGDGREPAYAEAAVTLGTAMAKAGIGLVYGGGSLGLMGKIARAVLDNGGRVTGIIPAFLSNKERMLRDVNELIVVEDMHQRKRLMFEKSDAFVALPGGVGTLEELVEQLTWSQLGQHEKPIILANINYFWNPLLALLEHMRAERFIRQGLEVRFRVVDTAAAIVPAVLSAVAASADIGQAANVPEKF